MIFRRLVLVWFVLLAGVNSMMGQRVAVKTNALYWLTATPNIGFEISLQQRVTLDVSGGYNPFGFHSDESKNSKLKHLLVQPEIRYWTCRKFSGHFLGINGLFSRYNVGGFSFVRPLKEDRFSGRMYGGGLSYGYQWVFPSRWAVEAVVGVGYLRLVYDQYRCGACGEKEGRYEKNYVGPVKAALSVVYFLR